jgi:hypothetical protein
LSYSHSDHTETSDFRIFFIASSFYPGRGNSVISDVPTHIHSKNEGLNDDDYGDTDVEEEEEWLSVPQPLEPESATRNTRAPHVLGIEVSSNFLFSIICLTALFVATSLERQRQLGECQTQ